VQLTLLPLARRLAAPHPLRGTLGDAFVERWDGCVAWASRSDVGVSVEGRPIVAYTLGHGPAHVLLTGLMHGIEIIGSVALRKLVELLDEALLSAATFTVVPIVNPDAFAANSRRLDALGVAGQRCNARGVDLNRNFPAIGGSSWHPMSGSRRRRSPFYSGEHAFSEPESRALRDVVLGAPPRLSLAFHSIGNLLLYPWGFTRAPHPQVAAYRALTSAFNAAAARPYRPKQGYSLYPTVGDLDDWLDVEHGCRALTIEVGTLDWRVVDPRRALNPFFWMNQSKVEEAADNAAAGALGLLRHALCSAR
jgi:predicted deacylase